MKIDTKLFAIARQTVGAEIATVEVPAQATVRDLRAALASAYPGLAKLLPLMMIAVDAEYAGDDHALREGVEVALIPPVSGG